MRITSVSHGLTQYDIVIAFEKHATNSHNLLVIHVNRRFLLISDCVQHTILMETNAASAHVNAVTCGSTYKYTVCVCVCEGVAAAAVAALRLSNSITQNHHQSFAGN